MVGPGGRELVGEARLGLAGASEARVSGGNGGGRSVATSLKARAGRVTARRQTSGQGQGDKKPPAKKARGHAAGAGREVRSGMDPGDFRSWERHWPGRGFAPPNGPGSHATNKI